MLLKPFEMKLRKDNFLIQLKYSDFKEEFKKREILSLGFGLELYFDNKELSGYDNLLIKKLQKIVIDQEIPLRLHAPIKKINYLDPARDISGIRLLYQDVIDACKLLNISNVVTHAELNEKDIYPEKNIYENALNIWKELSCTLKEEGIRLVVENHFEQDPDFIIRLINDIKLTSAGLCVDVGHVNAFGKIGILEWIKKCPNALLKEIHLADNNGDDDTHLPLGDGNIDFKSIFDRLRTINQKCIFVLEPKTPSDVKRSIEYLRNLKLFDE